MGLFKKREEVKPAPAVTPKDFEKEKEIEVEKEEVVSQEPEEEVQVVKPSKVEKKTEAVRTLTEEDIIQAFGEVDSRLTKLEASIFRRGAY